MITTMTQPPDNRRHSSVTGDEKERFPSFDDSARNFNLAPLAESPSGVSPITSIIPDYKWPARKGSQKATRDGRLLSTRGHRSRRSLSDALANLKNRRGSVTDNAQEIAEALKAPVSYKLIVSAQICCWLFESDPCAGIVYRMVHDFGPHEHLLEVDPEHLPPAGYTHYHTICFSLHMVPHTCIACTNLSPAAEHHSSA